MGVHWDIEHRKITNLCEIKIKVSDEKPQASYQPPALLKSVCLTSLLPFISPFNALRDSYTFFRRKDFFP